MALSQPDIADYAVIGDLHTAALVSRWGSIDWCCMPRFDSASCFGRLLDPDAGMFEIAPSSERSESHRFYQDDALVLVTRWEVGGAQADVIDCLAAGPDRGRLERGESRRSQGSRPGVDGPMLIRYVAGRRGEMEFDLDLAPRFDYGLVLPWLRQIDRNSWSLIAGDDGLVVESEAILAPNDERDRISARFTVSPRETVRTAVSFLRPEVIEKGVDFEGGIDRLDQELTRTVESWQSWSKHLEPSDRLDYGVRRSALVLRSLTYAPTGAIAAAATTSLPETAGGERNWDYRYSWIRDSSFASRTLAEVGAEEEAGAFWRFIGRTAAGRADELQTVYGVGGERRLGEYELDHLAGYLDSRPVRSGNAATDQIQLDSLGEIVNLAWRWHLRGFPPDDDEWRFLLSVIDAAAESSKATDRGIWEWRGDPEHFVHSKVMCWSALEHGLKLAEAGLRQAPVKRWKKRRDELHQEIHEKGSVDGRFKQSYEHDGMDGALLLIPTTGFVEWEDPLMIATANAVEEELGVGDGLIYRYDRKDSLKGKEGVFVPCAFWLTECLANQGRQEHAQRVFDGALACANDLGLFSEEWDPDEGRMLGNFPQGLSHLAHIAARLALRG